MDAAELLSPEPRNLDWATIEVEFRTGQLSVAQIARQHGLSRAAIYKRAKRDGWTQNLAEQVREEVAERLITEAVDGKGLAGPVTEIDARAAIDAAAARGVEVVRQHRKMLSDTFALVQTLTAKGQQTKERKIEAGVVRDLAQALRALIPLERQAFGLEDRAENAPITVQVMRF